MPWFSQQQLAEPDLPWIAVRTRVRSEKQVAGILAHLGLEAWAATAPVRRRWSDRWKVVEWPLFPGYAFARVPTDGWYPLLNLSGVHTVVKDGRLAATIDLQTMTDIRSFANRLGGVDAEPEHIEWYAPGDMVLVSDGPFAGVRAMVTEASGRRRVSVGMTLLGRGVSVTLPLSSVVRLSA